uniref:Uncharacterized protein n=1 Tax=viral metagenome TaxID=1070528 RepID=A0A6C0EJX9_9ZZZZ
MDSREEILSKLKFIGYIDKDEKLNIRYMTKSVNNWQTSLVRSLIYPDNRNNALKFVRDVISRSFEIIEHHFRHENLSESRPIIVDLIKSQQGLLNLKYTYSDDTKFCCDIDVLIEKILAKLGTIKEQHQNLFPQEEEDEE